MEIIAILLLLFVFFGIALVVAGIALFIAVAVLLLIVGLIADAFRAFKRYQKTLPPPRAPGTPRSGKEIAENILLSVVFGYLAIVCVVVYYLYDTIEDRIGFGILFWSALAYPFIKFAYPRILRYYQSKRPD